MLKERGKKGKRKAKKLVGGFNKVWYVWVGVSEEGAGDWVNCKCITRIDDLK